MPPAQTASTVHIVVPARNEQDSLGRCLGSLVQQQGIAFQITVVDDGSCDRTRAIAESFAGVHVIAATKPAPGESGKCNALIQGAAGATAEWLLFTDADTFHYPGSLAAAVAEAEERGADLLSYSPEQEALSWGERVLQPVVFAELARVYPPERVNNPHDPVAAANGQYLLVRRDAYQGLGGHQAVVTKMLEDVELARIFKDSHHKIFFRYGAGRVRARMYRDFASLVEGWTKNLALLFAHPLQLAVRCGSEFLAMVVALAAAITSLVLRDYATGLSILAAGALIYGSFFWRIRRAHFPTTANLTAVFGLPLFSWLLLRSWRRWRVGGAVTWKGRSYSISSCARPNLAHLRGRGDHQFHRGSKAEG